MLNDTDIKNILIVGTGGQGVVLASEILSYVAVASGFDAKKSEIHGMSQRGGVVSSHVRYGSKVASPTIMEGNADILLSFELAEALRWLPYLRPNGKVVTSSQRIVHPIVSMGVASYPENTESILREKTVEPIIVNAPAMAAELGNPRLVNTLLLGMVSKYLDLAPDKWKEVIKMAVPPKFKELNLTAFAHGAQL
ncbi:MAG: indolepyruvate oxidoreductase subunit beta [Desulfobulbaceae bacterium]|nr:indolepyruvate oxidoreductase subunit beta [Desulfobulbaceae bacterium]